MNVYCDILWMLCNKYTDLKIHLVHFYCHQSQMKSRFTFQCEYLFWSLELEMTIQITIGVAKVLTQTMKLNLHFRQHSLNVGFRVLCILRVIVIRSQQKRLKTQLHVSKSNDLKPP